MTPIEPGYYWGYTDGEWRVVEVFDLHGLHGWEHGASSASSLDEMDFYTRWQRIEPPDA